jgi:hypothetical protein
VDVRDVIEACFPEGTINVQSCKSSRNWPKYITKEDDEPLYNCKVSSTVQHSIVVAQYAFNNLG